MILLRFCFIFEFFIISFYNIYLRILCSMHHFFLIPIRHKKNSRKYDSLFFLFFWLLGLKRRMKRKTSPEVIQSQQTKFNQIFKSRRKIFSIHFHKNIFYFVTKINNLYLNKYMKLQIKSIWLIKDQYVQHLFA